MANNRMFLRNKRTGAQVMLARYYPSTGWYTGTNLSERLDEAFDAAAFGHLTPAQKLENQRHEGLGVPHKCAEHYSDHFEGDEWEIAYEITTEEAKAIEESVAREIAARDSSVRK